MKVLAVPGTCLACHHSNGSRASFAQVSPTLVALGHSGSFLRGRPALMDLDGMRLFNGQIQGDPGAHFTSSHGLCFMSTESYIL